VGWSGAGALCLPCWALGKTSSGDQGKPKAPANSPRSAPCPYSHNERDTSPTDLNERTKAGAANIFSHNERDTSPIDLNERTKAGAANIFSHNERDTSPIDLNERTKAGVGARGGGAGWRGPCACPGVKEITFPEQGKRKAPAPLPTAPYPYYSHNERDTNPCRSIGSATSCLFTL
jgi:hypothetical protein